MPLEAVLPQSACATCAGAAHAAALFRKHCQEAALHWARMSDQLTHTISLREWKPGSLFLNLLEDDTFEAIQDKKNKTNSSIDTLKAFKKKLKQKRRVEEVKRRKRGKEMASDIKCPDCDTQFASHLEMNKHLKYTSFRSCFICSEVVKLVDFREHLLVRHKKGSYVCKICSEVCGQQLQLRAHHKATHRRSHFCIECKRSFRSSFSLTAHKFVHERRTCNGCSITFTNRNCYSQHVKHCKTFVKEITEYTCDYCGKTYKGKDTLRMHIMLIHIRGRVFQCELCAKDFFSEAHLKEHSLIHDKMPDRFPCEFCDSKYSSRRGFEKHTRKHFEETAMAKEYLKLKKNKEVFVDATELNR